MLLNIYEKKRERERKREKERKERMNHYIDEEKRT